LEEKTRSHCDAKNIKEAQSQNCKEYSMNFIMNLDLFSVGITVLASIVLGVLTFINNRKSTTNRTFLIFTIAVSLWGVLNYLNSHISSPNFGLTVLRLVIFFALWQAFFLFQFFLVFPQSTYSFSRFHKFLLIPVTFITSILTLTPLVFKKVLEYGANGQVLKVENGPALPLFGSISVGLVIAGVIFLIRKIIVIKEKENRQPLLLVLFGTIITFALVIVFNFVLPAFFSNTNFIVFGSVFFFPFILFTSYAIIKHGLLNIKVLSTEIIVFVLAIPFLFEIINADTLIISIYKGFMFLLVLSIGLLLIKSVRKEVAQREELQVKTKELEKANGRLKELDQQKTDFLSIAAHQLRTPLSILNGYIELIKDGAYGKVGKEVKEILHNMDESDQRLVKLVDEFLDITRIEQGRTKYIFAAKDINAIIDSAVNEIKDRSEQKGLKIVWDPGVKLPSLVMDDEKVRHVVFNFIDNAIKYADKGAITVTAVEEDNGIAVRVADEGFGFGPTDKANFFQKFYRGENVRGTNVNGTGLGLYVCRKFIEAHQGKIWAHSPGLGKGSEFGFWIPNNIKVREELVANTTTKDIPNKVPLTAASVS